ncbi:uncharacterized protein LOC131048296 [Cryptomeria japonica]|uniref:uncharacterized protein LOC131048296 n=1 Tax=Cryptomeria japonica TaxID=3369 RepID=UPI0027D9F067|nr:uncharacterized protein LOC131048296 [Cryptomeria japonica]
MIWDPCNIGFSLLESHDSWLSGRVTNFKHKLALLIINVYGPTQNENKRRVWKEIEEFIRRTQEQTCIIGGDFNSITNQSEKRGGKGKTSRATLDFVDWIHRSGLVEINMVKNAFTWNNKRLGFSNIAEKLDRFFISGNLINFPYTLQASILPFSGLDHFPIQLNILLDSGPRRCPFKFEQMWLKYDNILRILEVWWKEAEVFGSRIFKVVNKLKIIKQKLIIWNREHYGNIFDKKSQVEAELKEVNKAVMLRGMDEVLFLREKELLLEQENILAKEEVFWKQKSRETWMDEGDNNTEFFHNSVKPRRVINIISKIKTNNGLEVEDPKLISKEAVDFFSNILNIDLSPYRLDQDKIMKFIPKLLSKEHTQGLTAKFSLSKVEAALMQMNLEKSPSPDGFPIDFFFRNASPS